MKICNRYFIECFIRIEISLFSLEQNTQTTLEGYTDETRKNDLEKQQISQKKIDKKVNEEVRRMMSEIFGCIESELLSFVTHHEKLDNVLVLILPRILLKMYSSAGLLSSLSLTYLK